MLADPKAHDAISEFHTQWLDYNRIGNITKDAALFPDYSPAIGTMMREEMSTFIDHAVFDDGGGFATLMTAPYSYMPPELASALPRIPCIPIGWAEAELLLDRLAPRPDVGHDRQRFKLRNELRNLSLRLSCGNFDFNRRTVKRRSRISEIG